MRVLGVNIDNIGPEDQERLAALESNNLLSEKFASKVSQFIQTNRRLGDDDWESAFTIGAELSGYLDGATRQRVNAALEDVIRSGDTRIKIIAFQAGLGDFQTKAITKPVVGAPPSKERNRQFIEIVNAGGFAKVANKVDDFFLSHFSYAESSGFDRFAFSALAQLGQAILLNHDTTVPLGSYVVNKYARRALNLNPNNTMAWSHAARALWAAGFLEQAEIYFWEAIRRNPDNSYFYGELSDLIFENFLHRRDESLHLLRSAELFVGQASHIENRIVKHLVSASDATFQSEGLARLTKLILRDSENPANIALLDALIDGGFPFSDYKSSVFEPLSINSDTILHLGKSHIGNGIFFAQQYTEFVIENFADRIEFKMLLLEFLLYWLEEIPERVRDSVLNLISPADTWAISYFEHLLRRAEDEARTSGVEAARALEFEAYMERFKEYPEWAHLLNGQRPKEQDSGESPELRSRQASLRDEDVRRRQDADKPKEGSTDAIADGTTEEPEFQRQARVAGMETVYRDQDDRNVSFSEAFSLDQDAGVSLREAIQIDASIRDFLSSVPFEIEIMGSMVRAEFRLRMGGKYRDSAIHYLREYAESGSNIGENFMKVICQRYDLFTELDMEVDEWEPSIFAIEMQRALSENDISILKRLEGSISGQEGLLKVFMAALGDKDSLQDVHDILLARETESSDTVVLFRRALGLRPQEEPPVWDENRVVQVVSGERAKRAMESVIDMVAGPYLLAA